jgi:hypothetical protein
MNDATRITVAALGALALAGCGSTGPGADPFVGTYDYQESNTFTITSPAMAPPMKGTASGVLTIAQDTGADYVVTIDAPGDGGAAGACALKTTAGGGTSLAFAAGQTCAVSGMGSTGTATLTSGTGALSGTTLTLDLAYDIAGMSPQGAFTATTVDSDVATRR